MTAQSRLRLAALGCGLLVALASAAADRDDDDAAADKLAGLPSLTAEQRRAVNLDVAHPVAARAPARLTAVGVVLDDAELVREAADAGAAEAADGVAAAELHRLERLYRDGGDASLKLLDQARAERARTRAAARGASARFALHWGPLATLSATSRERLVRDTASGRVLLLRTDTPGQHTFTELPRKGLVDVDGVRLPGRVLGALRQAGEAQGASLLLAIDHPPAGLGPGATLPVTLLLTEHSGLLVPREALLYDERGAYVFKALRPAPGDARTHYSPVRVKLIAAAGDGWIVDGVDDDDDVVVRGAGVLWSLQGVTNRPAAQDDDD